MAQREKFPAGCDRKCDLIAVSLGHLQHHRSPRAYYESPEYQSTVDEPRDVQALLQRPDHHHHQCILQDE